jgi:hypothetical protein
VAEIIRGITPTVISSDRSSRQLPERKPRHPRNNEPDQEVEPNSQSTAAFTDKDSKQKNEKEQQKGKNLDLSV